eukprot:568452-Prymnesium_polylepis.1
MSRRGTRPLWDASRHGRIAAEGRDASTSLVRQRACWIRGLVRGFQPSRRSRCIGHCMATLR